MSIPYISQSSLEAGVAVIKGYVKTLTSAPGVYRMLSGAGDVLYVGKAKNLKKRVSSYTRPQKQTIRIQRMIALTEKMEFVTTHTEAESLLLEANLMKSLKPRYNILFKDDKSFPYILLTDGDLPARLVMHRGAKSKKGHYFGPYASRHAVWTTLEVLSRIFKLRTCTDNVFKNRSRPCLQYYIKRCSGPCVARVTDTDYKEQVHQARQFLMGKTQTLQKDLSQKMQKASEARQYEYARDLRDQIQALTKTQEEQGVHLQGIDNVDVISVARVQHKAAIQMFMFRHGANHGSRSFFPSHNPNDSDEAILEAFLSWFYADQNPPKQILVNKTLPEQGVLQQILSDHVGYHVYITVPQRGFRAQLVKNAQSNAEEALALKLSDKASVAASLDGVAKVFGLFKRPTRIEVYDNSHNQGKEAYGAMIVAGSEGFDKKSYRKFKIKDIESHRDGGDDYAMMREVLMRRFRSVDPESVPDLVLLDGGRGQLSSGLKVMAALGVTHIPIVAIAKGPERNAGRETFYMPGRTPFTLKTNDPTLYYLQRLRDEAHRFVIGTHRQKKQKQLQGSGLDAIPGVGPKRRRDLLHYFGSLQGISEAGVKDLQKVEGISAKMAQAIYDYFH
jgi:excinuclease ABC subunit C